MVSCLQPLRANAHAKEAKMQHIGSIELPRGLLVQHIDLGGTLAMLVTIGLALVATGSLAFGVAVRAGIAPEFDRQITLNAQQSLVIHNGPSPTCAFSPNPPQHDCFRPGPELREFSVYYLTPHGVRSLLWFRLPQCACAAETSTPTASAPFASVCLCATR
jgi:hypothetical protein